mmetsp:Transcript_13308/g.33233  ORF Transcript_13308/g.33233 Transcript_13308/m.33233 type:complete len:304 (-) Transcript_13308:639-1550(-)
MQWLRRLFSFWLYLSLQMHMIGILLLLIMSITSATPPRSALPDMPSTSSRMSALFDECGTSPWIPRANRLRFVTISRSFVLSLFTPSLTSFCAVPRVSDAFTSVYVYPRSFSRQTAVDVLPHPGGPLSMIAFLDRSILPEDPFGFGAGLPCRCTSCHVSSHSLALAMCVLFPTSSSMCFGLYRTVHSSPAPADLWCEGATSGAFPLSFAAVDGAGFGGACAVLVAFRFSFAIAAAAPPSWLARSMARSPSSSIIGTFFSIAVVALRGPTSRGPTTRKFVLPLTFPVTLPPCLLMTSPSASRSM